jgi:hypothetical protein
MFFKKILPETRMIEKFLKVRLYPAKAKREVQIPGDIINELPELRRGSPEGVIENYVYGSSNRQNLVKTQT